MAVATVASYARRVVGLAAGRKGNAVSETSLVVAQNKAQPRDWFSAPGAVLDRQGQQIAGSVWSSNDLGRKSGSVFRMNDRARQRHCNPWSVYTRFTMIRHRSGTLEQSLASVVGPFPHCHGSCVGVDDPRRFPPPISTDNWASKVVLGEWVWMRRNSIAIPVHHRLLPNLLSIAAGLGMAVFLIGVSTLHLWLSLLGGAIAILAKLWFADRMVWLYQEMKDATPEYRKWLY